MSKFFSKALVFNFERFVKHFNIVYTTHNSCNIRNSKICTNKYFRWLWAPWLMKMHLDGSQNNGIHWTLQKHLTWLFSTSTVERFIYASSQQAALLSLVQPPENTIQTFYKFCSFSTSTIIHPHTLYFITFRTSSTVSDFTPFVFSLFLYWIGL